MTKQNKFWAVVHPIEGVVALKRTKEDLSETIARLEEYDRVKEYHLGEKCRVVELVEAPEKIKMTDKEWEEFKNGLFKYHTFFEFLCQLQSNNILFGRFFNGNNFLNGKAHADFARLWVSEHPEELVEIEKEKKYELIFKATTQHQGLIGAGTDYAHAAYSEINQVQYYTQSEIDSLGGDEKLAEWGVKKVEVEE